MSNTDFRVQVTWAYHWKTKRLTKTLGKAGPLHLIFLWSWVAVNKPDGDLSGMSDLEIESSADWDGPDGHFIQTLKDCRFLDGDEMSRSIHDWKEHNKWCATFTERSERNSDNAASGWQARKNKSHAKSEKLHATRNATSKVRKGKEGEGEEREGNGKVLAPERMITDCYQELYLDRYHKKPPWSAKEGKRIRELLASFEDDSERICSAIRAAFDSDIPFLRDNCGSFMTLTAAAVISKADTAAGDNFEDYTVD